MTIDINKQEPVSTTGGKDLITGPSWNPSEGYSRQRQIEEARLEAMAEQAKQAEAALPHNIRLAKIEGAIANLQKRVEELENAQTKSK